jgi:hypothetical protein
MVARVITFQLQPGKTSEMLEIVNHSVVPLMQQQVGCKLITMLSDATANKVLAVGLPSKPSRFAGQDTES